ncbi:MAG: adenine deaminase [Chitinophagaceae bacterium]|nr:adenine deaminase [Chitinophagaceae bacterium]
MTSISGNIVDVYNEKIFEGNIEINNGRIAAINIINESVNSTFHYILPGFIDAHVHIESSMLVPSEFARLAVVHGTVATVSDPHEIANVCGMDGVEFMINNGNTINFKFYFGAPSCVPATIFETAGAVITADDIKELLSRSSIKYLSEMMNFPGVIFNDPEVMQKINIAHQLKKPVDGHAPGLGGEPLKKYVSAGISTDHECFTRKEAEEKLRLGVKILIREGSAAKNFEALIDLLHDHPHKIMFCSDDKHPDSLVQSHINALCECAVAKGINVFNVLRAACINPVEHYKLDTGTLRINDAADFIVVQDLKKFKVLSTYINGICVSENGKSLIKAPSSDVINNFDCNKISASDISRDRNEFLRDGKLPVIEALDGQLITNKLFLSAGLSPARGSTPHGARGEGGPGDILKIVVINRYNNAPPAISFIKNFNLKSGAIASSVAHDSHNIIAVGADDESIAKAINLIIENKGGVSCVSPDKNMILPLPVAGLMSADDGYKVAEAYTAIDAMAKSLGSTLSAPFMTLSFMALLVIPHLKLSDKGLFDGDIFSFI